MRKLTLLTSIIFFLNTGVHAQKYFPFPTGNVNWNVYFLGTCDERPPDTFLLRYTIHGDTIIKGIKYKKLCLEHGDTSHLRIEPVGGIRELDKRIYYSGKNYLGMDAGCEFLLYDFNKQIGDTVFRDNYGNLITVILAIDSIKIGNEYRKRYKVDNHWLWHNPDYVIEGIGNILDGLLGHITFVPTCGFYYWENMCFYVNGQLLYQNPTFNECYPNRLIQSIHNQKQISDLKIYPNPFSDEFQVDNIPIGKILFIKIFDSMGRLIYQNEVTHENNKINLLAPGGFYTLEIIDKGGQLFKIEKIIKK